MGQPDSIKFSIVTPVYNSEEVIQDLLKSVLDQEYANWEMIIQDGVSSDDTLNIIDGLADERIKVYSEKDKGMYDALNKAIEKASGDYILHLNSDEQLMHGALDTVEHQIREKPNYEAYCFGVIILDKERKPRVFRAAYPQKTLFIKLFNLDIFTAGIVYKKSIFKKIKFDTHYKVIADALLFIELVKNFSIYYSKIYTTFFLIEGKNLSLENIGIKERQGLKSSVKFSKLLTYLLFPVRKLFKLYHNCRTYTGPGENVIVFHDGEKIEKNLSDISYELNWNNFI